MEVKMEQGKRLGYLGIGLVLLVLSLTVPTRADEISELKKLLNEQAKVLQQLQERITHLEARQRLKERSLTEKIQEVAEQKQAPIQTLPDSIEWIEKIKWSGDFRYRHDTIDDDSGSTTRDRNRIRARLKMEAEVNDEWDAVFRLATGSSDSPTSTNHTLGDSSDDSFSSKEIWLDQAFANYHPESMPGLNLLAGKMSNPFYRVGKNQVIYDGDISPEGGAAMYKWDMDDSTSAQLTGAAFWLSERSTDADTSIFGIQGLLKRELDCGSRILGGVSYYDFGNIKGKALTSIGSKGNSTTGGIYSNDYDVLEGFSEYSFMLGEVPAAIYGSYVRNMVASNSGDTAWIVGARYNKAKDPGSWEATYDYRDVQRDAVVGGLNDSDFIGGGADGNGHVFGFNYQLAKNVQAGVLYYLNEKNMSTSEDDYQLLQANLVFKF
jgi:hypothetical protein